MRWCLDLPGARLGVAVGDVASIVASIVQGTPAPIPPDIEQLLSRFGANSETVHPWY
jgi:hypothetical protein